MPQDFMSCLFNLELTCSLLSFGLVLALKWNLRFFHCYGQMTTQTRASRILGFQLVRKPCSSALLFIVLVMMHMSFPCLLKNNTTKKEVISERKAILLLDTHGSFPHTRS